MHSLARSVYPAIFLALLSACNSGSEREGVRKPEKVSFLQSAVQGGYDDATDKGVAYIQAVFPSGNGGACTGTLIARNVVLTARHCVSDVDADLYIPPCGNWTFSNPTQPENVWVSFDQAPDQYSDWFAVQEVRVPTGAGTNDICGYDVAILILDVAVSSTVATPFTPRISVAPQNGEEYSAVGFGLTCPSCGSGERMRRDNLNVYCVGSCGQSAYVSNREWSGDDGVCSGDSGGPALDDSDEVIGVASRAGEDGNSCVGAVYERVDSWSAMLIDAAQDGAALGGYPAPDWAGGGGGTQDCQTCQDNELSPGASCYYTIEDCQNSQPCLDFYGCYYECADADCASACYQQHPQGALLYNQITECVCTTGCTTECSTECAVPSCGGFELDPPACQNCFDTQCCDEGEACIGSVDCNAYLWCINSCADDPCYDNCANGYATGAGLYMDIIDCYNGPCGTDCGEGGSGGAGGSPGSGGSNAGGSSLGGAPGWGGDTNLGGAPGWGGSSAGGAPGSGGDVGAGGAPSAGGDTGLGGDPNAGGNPNAGGDTGLGGDPNAGGNPNAGGDTGLGGDPNAGGAPGAGGDTGLGGDPNAGGAPGAGGDTGLGGDPNAGGTEAGGNTSEGGSETGEGGEDQTAGSAGDSQNTGGTSNPDAGAGGTATGVQPAAPAEEDSGCGCRTAGTSSSNPAAIGLLAALGVVASRRRK